jgi:pimeloyl-ACP methyl ester carboxylesterase
VGTKATTRRQFIRFATAVSVGASTLRTDAASGMAGWPDSPAHFVLVHGAWHGAWCWYKIAAGLVRAGQGVTTLDLPAAGIDPAAPAAVTRQAQVDRVLAAIDAVGERVILVGHSAGGPVVSAVAEAAPEKIAKLVYLSAFLLPDGVSLVQVSAADTASVLSGALIIRLDLGTIDVEPSARRDAFYNRSDDAHVALADTLLRPVSFQALVAPLHVGPNFASVRRFYITCLRDQAISPAVQQQMYTQLPCERVLVLRNSDHSPFFSRPRDLLRALRDIAST